MLETRLYCVPRLSSRLGWVRSRSSRDEFYKSKPHFLFSFKFCNVSFWEKCKEFFVVCHTQRSLTAGAFWTQCKELATDRAVRRMNAIIVFRRVFRFFFRSGWVTSFRSSQSRTMSLILLFNKRSMKRAVSFGSDQRERERGGFDEDDFSGHATGWLMSDGYSLLLEHTYFGYNRVKPT